MVTREAVVTGALLSALSVLPASAHTPADDGYVWTCSGGEASTQTPGACYGMTSGNPPVHHSNADARFYYEPSVDSDWLTPVNVGYLAWDQTNGHQFNFIRETTDTSSNANVSVTGFTICGDPAAVGCTSNGVDSGNHIIEGSATIKFKSSLSASLRDDASAHEFGHYLGLGHAIGTTATMYGGVFAGASTLSAADSRGRCQVYGHAHGYWGGCP